MVDPILVAGLGRAPRKPLDADQIVRGLSCIMEAWDFNDSRSEGSVAA